MLDILLPKLHKEGQKFLTISLVVTFIFLLFSKFLGFVGIVISIWVFYFFRDPERVVIGDDNYLVSPADGEIIKVEEIEGPKELNLENKKFKKISIFMNVFDVHVNRSPMLGQITYKKYIPGSFLNASLDKASDKNERLILNMDADNGNKIAFVQIAGLVARRIICDVDIGHSLKAGEVFGLIRFGSRVDIYFPSEVSVMVLKGQKMIAGETIIGDFSKNAKPVKEITDEK